MGHLRHVTSPMGTPTDLVWFSRRPRRDLGLEYGIVFGQAQHLFTHSRKCDRDLKRHDGPNGSRRRGTPSRIASLRALGHESRPFGEVAASAADLPVFAAVPTTA